MSVRFLATLKKSDLFSSTVRKLRRSVDVQSGTRKRLFIANLFCAIILPFLLNFPKYSSYSLWSCSPLHSIIGGKFLKCLVINSNHYECALCTWFDWNIHCICIITVLLESGVYCRDPIWATQTRSFVYSRGLVWNPANVLYTVLSIMHNYTDTKAYFRQTLFSRNSLRLFYGDRNERVMMGQKR